MEGYWAVVITQPNCERRAELNLTNQGFEVFSPMIRGEKLNKQRRLIAFFEPLFRRYIFCKIEGQWRNILNTYGVSRVIMADEKPIPVPSEVISAIKDREDSRGYISLEQAPKFKKNQKVRVLSGPFANSIAVFECQTNAARVRVLLELLGRRASVELDEKEIASA